MSVVLIVEADVLVAAAIARGIQGIPSVEVVTVTKLREAIELSRRTDVHLVICDLELPDGSALEVLSRIAHKRESRIPSVLIGPRPGPVLAAALPADLRVIEKPIDPEEIRATVSELIAEPMWLPPLGLGDYLLLASLGKMTSSIDVLQDGDHTGTIVVRNGDAWCAKDELGAGMDAFLRTSSVSPDPVLVCTAPSPGSSIEHTLTGSCEQLVADATRILAERRAQRARAETAPAVKKPVVIQIPPKGIPPAPTAALASGTRSGVSAPKPIRPTPAPAPAPTPAPPARPVQSDTSYSLHRNNGLHAATPLGRIGASGKAASNGSNGVASDSKPATSVGRSSLGRGSDPAVPPPIDYEFERLYDQGIDALLRKRYAEALDLLTRARVIRSTPTLEANLQRLRTLGFS